MKKLSYDKQKERRPKEYQTPIYARDLRPECLTDTFMGEGFEARLRRAEAKDEDLIVGYFKEI